ncbi:MAG: IS200/IS605 family transposase [Bacteroidota bacterium]|nr:IS200/IS605 family transposase [Bacteroidota bacterium]
MSDTYTTIHLQFVLAVRNREGTIHASWKDELYKYITGIVQHYGHKMICINGMPDHIHILIGMRPTQSVADLVREIKSNSSKWIKEKKFVAGIFEWQAGYGAFSYSKSHLPNVINYIKNQELHHKTVSFRAEYVSFLEEFEITHEEKHIFQELV